MSGWLVPAVFTAIAFVLGKASKGLLKYVMYIAAFALFITTFQEALADPWLVSVVIGIALVAVAVMVFRSYRKRRKPPQRMDYHIHFPENINFPPEQEGRHRR